MRITRCALAAALGVVALMAPRVVQADTVLVTLKNITFTGASVCGATGTSPCMVSLNGSFQWNNTLESAVSGTFSASASGPINLATLTVSGLLTSPTPPQDSLSATFTDPGGDSAIFGINFSGTNLPLGTYTFTTGSPIPGTFDQLGGQCVTPVCNADFGNSSISAGTVLVTVTPEPSTLLMLGSGLLGLMGMAFRRKRLA